MSKFFVGDIVEVVDNTSDHMFLIGEKVRITYVYGEGELSKSGGCAYKAEHLDGSDFWWMHEDDVDIS